MDTKTVTIHTRQKKTTFRLKSDGKGFNVYRVEYGVFSDSEKRIGHGSNLENAIAIARAEIGEGSITAVDIRN